MPTSAGRIQLDLGLNTSPFKKDLNGITGLAKKAATALASAFAVKQIVSFGKECLDLASDLEEVQNVVDVTFPSMSAKVDEFAKSAAASFGLSETMAKQYTGTFGAMAKAFGFSEQQAYDMSTSLTGLAGDVASFYNLSQDEAFGKLKSIFSGETESLKSLGVVMTQTALDQYALANGFGKTTKSMSEAEKVALRYSFVQDQLSAASGDFARTSDSWANQVKLLSLQFDSLKASIGSGLIAAFKPAIQVLNILIGKLVTAANAFASFMKALFGGGDDGASGVAAVVADAVGSAADSSDSMSDSTGKTAKILKKAQNSLAGFDKITKLSDNSDDGADSGSGVSGGSIGGMDFGGFDTGGGIVEKAADGMAAAVEKFKAVLHPAIDAFNRFKESLQPLGETLGAGAKWIMDNVLVPFGNWTISEVVPRFFDTLSAVVETANNILTGAQPAFQWFWDNLLKPIAEWTGGVILDVWDKLNEALQTFSDWCKENPAVIETLTTIVLSFATAVGIVAGVLGTLHGVMSIVSKASAILSGAIAFITSPVGLVIAILGALIAIGILVYQNWDVIKEKAIIIWGAIRDWFETTIEKIKTFFVNLWSGIVTTFQNVGGWFKGKFDGAVSGIRTAFSTVGTFFSGIWTNIKKTFANIPNWFKTKFTEAWTAVKNVFSKGGQIFAGIKDGILDGLKSVINGLISGINTVISVPFNGINSALDTIRGISIAGLKPFSGLPSIGVPQIPQLAQGGFVKKNTPQLAMIGDNRHQGEVVAPEDKLQEMVNKAVAMSSGGISREEMERIMSMNTARIVAALAGMGFFLDGEQLARAEKRAQTGLNRRYNTVELG